MGAKFDIIINVIIIIYFYDGQGDLFVIVLVFTSVAKRCLSVTRFV